MGFSKEELKRASEIARENAKPVISKLAVEDPQKYLALIALMRDVKEPEPKRKRGRPRKNDKIL